MSIKTTVERVKDIFQDSQWPLFDYERAMTTTNHLPQLGVLSFISVQHDLPRDMAKLDTACITLVKPSFFSNPLLSSYKVWLFAANDSWLPNSPVSAYKAKRKKLWESFPDEWRLANLHPRQELLLESDEGLRFAGLAEVNEKTFDIAVHFLRKNSASAIIVSNREEITHEKQVRSLFYSSFPEKKGVPQIAIDWMTLSLNVCPHGDVVIRISGSYDERCAAIDCIMLSKQLSLFKAETLLNLREQ